MSSPATATLRLDDVLTQVAKDKGIDKLVLVSTLEDAIKTAAKKHFGQERALNARYNPEKDGGVVELSQTITVVETLGEALDAVNQMPLALAHAKGGDFAGLSVGDELEFPILYRDDTEADREAARLQDDQFGDILGLKTFRRGFGRIAAQTAKQVLVQRTRDVERENVFNEYKDRKGEIVTGIARRLERGNLIVDLGRAESVLPVREQVPREVYRPGDRVQAFVLDVLREAKGPQIILSRASVNLLTKLFEMEVPEIAEGIVVIEAAAREPGRRSKIAVSSRDGDVDPVGACVGVKGSRVQAVVQELRGEKIDIVEFDEDPVRFVCEALKPAEVSRVIIDEANHAMEIIVPDDQLSLAIGRSGQNVRLAAQLTGWKLDINSESRVKEMREFADRSLGALPGMNEMLIETLYANGFRMAKDIANASAEVLAQIPGMNAERVAEIQEKARAQTAGDAEELAKLEQERQQRRLEEERKHPDELSQEERLARVRGIGTTNVDSFKQSGFGMVEDIVKEQDLTRLGNVAGIGIKKARQIKAAAEHYLQEESRRRTELDALKKAGVSA